MVKNKPRKNLNLIIILSILLFLLSICTCNRTIETKNKNKIIEYNPSDKKTDKPDKKSEIMKQIYEAKSEKNTKEIELQKKKIYVISLAVLSSVFLILIIIFVIFKCYIFCNSRKQGNISYRNMRISKLGQVSFENNLCGEKSEIKDTSVINSEINNDNTTDNNNDAPSCFTVSQKFSTFDPNNYDDINDFYKPMNNENI